MRQNDSYLLVKGSGSRKLWPNKYNGIGGHIERGEDALGAAVRELREETGLEARLWLCGIVLVDAGKTGVALYVFCGEVSGGSLMASTEGTAEWVPLERISELNVVEDLPQLLARIGAMRSGDPPFSARSYYDEQNGLQIRFSD